MMQWCCKCQHSRAVKETSADIGIAIIYNVRCVVCGNMISSSIENKIFHNGVSRLKTAKGNKSRKKDA